MTEEPDGADQRLAAARRFLSTCPVIEDWAEQLAQHFGDSPARRAQLRELLVPHAAQIEATHVAALVRFMTAAEIDGLARFQSSPIGRAIMRKQAAIQTALVPALMPLIQRVAEDALRTPPTAAPGSDRT